MSVEKLMTDARALADEQAGFLTELEAHMRADGSFSDAQITNILHACSGWVFSFPQAPSSDEDEDLYCENCGVRIPDGRGGLSVEWPGIPEGEIIVCVNCARGLRLEAGEEGK